MKKHRPRSVWQRFTTRKRAVFSLWIFLALFTASLFSECIANDRPLLVRFDGKWYAPVLHTYSELDFGGEFDIDADYRDPFVAGLIL